MTEKRFTFNCDSNWWTISDNTTNDERLWGQDVVDRLNELAEENKKLKQEIKGFEGCSHNFGLLYDEAKNKVEELSKENKELKQEIESLKMEIVELRESENDNYNISDGLW